MDNKELNIINKAYKASLEINGVSKVLQGLTNQLDNENNNSLTVSALTDAMYAVEMHLERIAADLANIGK